MDTLMKIRTLFVGPKMYIMLDMSLSIVILWDIEILWPDE